MSVCHTSGLKNSFIERYLSRKLGDLVYDSVLQPPGAPHYH